MNLTETHDEAATEAPAPMRSRRLAVTRVLTAVGDAISLVCSWLIGALLLVMLASVTYQVVGRYWMPSVVGGPEELARLAMIAMVFLGLPVLAHKSEHIRLDVAQEMIRSARVREWITRFALAVELVFFTWLTLLAWEFVDQLAQSAQQSPSLGVRLVWSRLPVFLGSGLATLVAALVLARRLLGGAAPGSHEISVKPI